MNPLVSIIIPTKDNVEYLSKCINSLNNLNYNPFEVIIVSNRTEKQSTKEYLKKLSQYPNVIITELNISFNYSKLNNHGVDVASGEYLLFLNDDIEIIDSYTIEKFIEICKVDEVGAVGATLLFEDHTIQHIGVNIFETNVYHPFKFEKLDNLGFIGKTREVSSVTGACIFTSKRKFEEVDGFDSNLVVLYNDIDFCLKLREKGYKVYCSSEILMYHYESKSREVKPHLDDWEIFFNKWTNYIENGDPFDITDSINKSNINDMMAKISQETDIYIWGTGARGLKALHLLDNLKISVSGFVDNNKEKWGTIFNTFPVVSVESLSKNNNKKFFFIALQQYPIVKKQLEMSGYKQHKHFIQIY